MLNRSVLIAAASTLLATSVPLVASADVLFSTFGANNSYATTGSLVSGSSSPSTAFSKANEFTAGFSGQLSGLSVAVDLGSSAPASDGYFDLEVAPNNPATNLPLVASAQTVGTLQATSPTATVLSLTSPSTYTFAAGNAYWLILTAHTSTTDITWEGATNSAATDTAYMSITTKGQFVAENNGADAFQISATVPEPDSMALLVLGGAGLLWLARAIGRHSRAAARFPFPQEPLSDWPLQP